MRIAGQPTTDLAAEPVEVGLAEAALEEGAGVDPGGGVSLDEHLVTVAPSALPRKKWLNPTS